MNKSRSIIDCYIHGCQGDNDAFSEFVRLAYPRLQCYISRLAIDKSQMDDVCQETFLIAFKKYQNYDPKKSLYAWLYSIARHRTLKALKSYKEVPMDISTLDHLVDPVFSGVTEGEHQVELQELQQLIAKNINQLPPYLREVIYLRYFESLSYTEISGITGYSNKVLQEYIYRINKRLRKSLKNI